MSTLAWTTAHILSCRLCSSVYEAQFSPVVFNFLRVSANSLKCLLFFCVNLWFYCACARLLSRQSSLFTFAHTISKCPEMPSLFGFNLWSYCACARLIFRQSYLFSFAYLQMPGSTFLFQSVVLLLMRQAHFSLVIFIHFLRISANDLKCLLFFVSICGLTAHAPGSFLASRLCSYLRVSPNALKCLPFLF